MKISVPAIVILSKEHARNGAICSLIEKSLSLCKCQSPKTQFRPQTDASLSIET